MGFKRVVLRLRTLVVSGVRAVLDGSGASLLPQVGPLRKEDAALNCEWLLGLYWCSMGS